MRVAPDSNDKCGDLVRSDRQRHPNGATCSKGVKRSCARWQATPTAHSATPLALVLAPVLSECERRTRGNGRYTHTIQQPCDRVRCGTSSTAGGGRRATSVCVRQLRHRRGQPVV